MNFAYGYSGLSNTVRLTDPPHPPLLTLPLSLSQEEPEAWLNLNFVYGYSGLSNTAPNVFFTSAGDVAYYTAGVGIVYNKASHTQKFFLGHDK